MSFVWILAPVLILYYESNEKETLGKRVCSALKKQLPIMLLFISILVPTYYWFNGYEIKEHECHKFGLTINGVDKNGNPVHVGEFSFFWHVYSVTVWMGWFAFAIFGGVGLIVLPYNLICDFIYRPKPISPSEFKRRKKVLLPLTLKLRTQGKSLGEQ